MKIHYLFIALLLSLTVVTALDYTNYVKQNGAIRLNKNQQTKVETALGINFSTMTGVSSNSITVVMDGLVIFGSITIITATINKRTYTIIVQTNKIEGYIK